jgi:uroporphyrinogen decarboxylase
VTSRERVIDVIEHRTPDRVPIYGWVKANLSEQISAAFGSVEAFEDRYEFDFSHLFGGPATYDGEALKSLRASCGGAISPTALLDLAPNDPNTDAAYDNIRQQVQHHKTERQRFVYVQTPGIFEALNGPFGIENHLMYLALYPEELKDVYQRQAEWNRQFAMNCLDLGVDMVHVSDDWGAQESLLFSPATWWELIFPFHRITCQAVKERGAYLSVHSDGNVNQVLDGIVELGYDVVHPFQESAGMDFGRYLREFSDKFVLMGGLDVQTTIGFGDYGRLESDIERVLGLFRRGGMLFCTSHYVQDHCTIEELTFAYDLIYDVVRRP